MAFFNDGVIDDGVILVHSGIITRKLLQIVYLIVCDPSRFVLVGRLGLRFLTRNLLRGYDLELATTYPIKKWTGLGPALVIIKI